MLSYMHIMHVKPVFFNWTTKQQPILRWEGYFCSPTSLSSHLHTGDNAPGLLGCEMWLNVEGDGCGLARGEGPSSAG